MDISLKGLILLISAPLIKAFVAFGAFSVILAVVNERRMQKHRQPGVSYSSATLRRDGGWRRSDLFTDEGLAYQRRAARWAFIGIVCILMGMLLATLSS